MGELAEAEAEARDRKQTVTRCSFCQWSHEGPAGEGRELARQHRAEAHPDVPVLCRIPGCREQAVHNVELARGSFARLCNVHYEAERVKAGARISEGKRKRAEKIAYPAGRDPDAYTRTPEEEQQDAAASSAAGGDSNLVHAARRLEEAARRFGEAAVELDQARAEIARLIGVAS